MWLLLPANVVNLYIFFKILRKIEAYNAERLNHRTLPIYPFPGPADAEAERRDETG